MATKKSYSRYFIILQEEEKGYSLASDKLSSGYAKFEIKNDKCKVTYYVQNLKKETGPYHMVLICNKKDVKKIIKLGELNIDSHGRTEIVYEYNNEDVASSGISVEKVVGAAIVKFADTNIIPVMVGFITTETQEDWKQYAVVSKGQNKLEEPTIVEDDKLLQNESIEKIPLEINDKQEVEEQIEKVNNYVVDPIINETEVISETLMQENRNISSEITEEKNIFDSYEENIPIVKSNNEMINQDDEIINQDDEIINQDNDMINEKINEDNEKINQNIEQMNLDIEAVKQDAETINGNAKKDFSKGAIADYFKMVANGLEEVKDVCKEINNCKWYKVHINNRKDLCDISDYNKYSVIYYPMYSYFKYIKKYKHVLLGYKYDNIGRMKYIVFAIPGKREIMEQPFEGKTGFVTWVPSKTEEESLGYWLMFYDFGNRTIAIPIKT